MWQILSHCLFPALYLDNMITQTEVELYVRIQPYYEYVELVSTITGITELSAAIILAEIGVNMDIFENAKHLCSWRGLSPANNAERNFRICLRIVNVLLPNGLLTEKEAVRVRNKLIKIYKSVTGFLYDSKDLF